MPPRPISCARRYLPPISWPGAVVPTAIPYTLQGCRLWLTPRIAALPIANVMPRREQRRGRPPTAGRPAAPGPVESTRGAGNLSTCLKGAPERLVPGLRGGDPDNFVFVVADVEIELREEFDLRQGVGRID